MAEPAAWTTACPDWQERLLAGRSLVPVAPLFPEAAEEALAVLRALRIVDVAGRPTVGEAARPWMLDFAAAIFGAYDHEAGRQLISQALLLVSKKNWKSGVAATIMLTTLILNWRESAEFLIIAPSVEVAGNSFKPAADMVRADPELAKILHVSTFHRTITHRTTGAVLKVVAADSDAVSGKKATAVLVEELWAFGKKAHAENMLIEATGGLAARPEGFVIYISTMSDDQPAGVFKQKLDYFRAVRDGEVQDRSALPVLYEWPRAMLESEAYLDPRLWYATNPNLGASVSREYLEKQFSEKRIEGGGALRSFLAKHLNVEVDIAMRAGAWAGARHWSKRVRRVTLTELLALCEVVTLGFDGGGLDDLLGMAAVGRERGTGNWLSWNRAWVQRSVLELRQSEAARLQDFHDAGDLRIVEDGSGDDIAELVALAQQVKRSRLLPEKFAIGVDPGNHHAVTGALLEAGFPAEQLAWVSQGWKLGGVIKLVERSLAEGKFWHAGQPLMAWCVGNARVELKSNAMLITKQASGTAKIDPLMATLNAAERMASNPQAATCDVSAMIA